MKIDLVGSMCTWTKELSTSFIINDEILLDVPQGSFKTLRYKYDLSKIKYIVFTHFHSDHFLDIHLVLEVFKQHYKDKKITILAPKTCKERLLQLFKIIETDYLLDYVNNNITFIDCENEKTIQLGDYNITPYLMLHGKVTDYGYTIEQNKKTIGFSGDTSMCDNLHKILKNSKVAFIDCASTSKNDKHLSVEEFCNLQKQYSNTKMYPIHTHYPSKELLQKSGVETLKDQDIVKLD